MVQPCSDPLAERATCLGPIQASCDQYSNPHMCLVYFIGAFLIKAMAVGIIGDFAGTISGVVLTILWAVSIFKAEPKSNRRLPAWPFLPSAFSL